MRLQPGSLAARAAGGLHVPTKSHHHQAIDALGTGLCVTGWSELDDLPEAIELPAHRFALGVQWHPEADAASEVIAALVAEARTRALGCLEAISSGRARAGARGTRGRRDAPGCCATASDLGSVAGGSMLATGT